MNKAKSVFFTDLNPKATENAVDNAKHLNIKHYSASSGNLFEHLGGKKFDVIIFNPPGFSGSAKNYIEATLINDMETIKTFFTEAPKHLNNKDGIIIVPTSTVHDEQDHRLNGLNF